MTAYAWRAAPGDPWTELVGQVVVGIGEDGEDVAISSEFADSLSPEVREVRGFVAVEEAEHPIGVTVLGSALGSGIAPVRAWNTEPYTEAELTALRERMINRIRGEAGRRIMAAMVSTASWSEVEGIRDACAAVEAALPEDAPGLLAFDVAGSELWPS